MRAIVTSGASSTSSEKGASLASLLDAVYILHTVTLNIEIL